jgi:predicted unusual protein kinase regulating ubiquinone biosynthesis (AarF/ABC1/UbiB family)
MFLHEALAHGVIHGDSHPGNFLVAPDGRVVLLDFGCVKELPLNQRRGLVDFVLGGMDGNLARMIEGFKLMGYAKNAEQAAPYLALTVMFLGGVTSSKLLESVSQEKDLVHAIREHELYRNVPPDQIFLLRKFFGLVGICQELSKGMDPATADPGSERRVWNEVFLPVLKKAEAELSQ